MNSGTLERQIEQESKECFRTKLKETGPRESFSPDTTVKRTGMRMREGQSVARRTADMTEPQCVLRLHIDKMHFKRL